MSDDNIIQFNPWTDFNDAALAGHAAPLDDLVGVEPDAAQIATFLDVVFGYCEGLIPVRGFVDKGQGKDGNSHRSQRPHNIWIDADDTAPEKLAMGWPTKWTDFDFAATAWSPWLQHMRSEFLRLGSVMMADRVVQ